MTDKINDQNSAIINVLSLNPMGMSRGQVLQALTFSITDKTLQRRLAALVAKGQIRKEGDKRTTRYFSISPRLETNIETPLSTYRVGSSNLFSTESMEALSFLDLSAYSRPKVSYNSKFLENYVPNEIYYVPIDIREELTKQGKRVETVVAAGTYARQILHKLLIELSYNSSRLEGNTYSRLDTQRLIEQNITAEGKVDAETVMIMNHKEAISFLVDNAEDIDPSTFTIYGLHYFLSQDLLANSQACGQIRQLDVSIGKSAYKPISNPHVLKETLELLLLKARRIKDPFEQSFFLLLHISYLQAFEDVNKRTARLACNIPFIKMNLCPLSFTDLPKDDYIAALLLFYETNDIRPMLDVFRWAYLRSCDQYDVVKESMGQVDIFRVRYRQERKEVMGQIIRENIHGTRIEKHIESYCSTNQIEDIDKFIAMTITALKELHANAIIGLGITENQFNEWKKRES